MLITQNTTTGSIKLIQWFEILVFVVSFGFLYNIDVLFCNISRLRSFLFNLLLSVVMSRILIYRNFRLATIIKDRNKGIGVIQLTVRNNFSSSAKNLINKTL